MFHRWAALVLVLALCAITPKNAAGQTQSQKPRGHSAGGIGANSPNPFNPDTYIPFTVGDESCTGVSEQHVVTMRILNVLAQPVVVPQMWGSTGTTAAISESLHGLPLTNVTLGCGTYKAYWNGRLTGSGREASSGVYAVQLFIDGQLIGTSKIFYAK
jgi:hypothetical protein